MSIESNNSNQPVEGRLLIIDAMALAYRAYYAIPPRKSPVTGEPTNAIYGFTSMLLSLLDKLRPEFVAVALEGGNTNNYRTELYPEYKATRPAMPAELKEQMGRLIYLVEKGLGIPCFRREGYEADDVIAALATLTITRRHYPKPQREVLSVIISTGDKDMLQLVDDRVQVFMAAQKFADSKLYGTAEVVEKYGFAPAQLPLYLALLGDKVDNIPGVPGVGEQTARKLTIAYGDIEKLTTAAKDTTFGIQQKRVRLSILDNLEQLQRNLRLVNLVGTGAMQATGIIGFVPTFDEFGSSADQITLIKLFEELGFSESLSGKLNGLLNRFYDYRQQQQQLTPAQQ